MACRDSLHSMVDLLADYGVLEGRKVSIEIVNGTEVRWTYDPPLHDKIAPLVAMKERTSLEKEAWDRGERPAVQVCH